MKSLIGGMASFRIATFLKCADHSGCKLLPSDLRSWFLHYSDVPGLCLCKDRYGLL